MTQKISAMKYIKNNKRRTSVLVVSLGLCFVLTYLTKFLLSSTEESIKPIVLENTKKMQVMTLAGKTTLGIDTDGLSDEELSRAYAEKNLEVAEKLKKMEGVKNAYFAQIIYGVITPVIGNMTYEMPLVDKEEIPAVLEHFGAKLIKGRLPENPGEVVLDELSMKNNAFELDGYFNEDNYLRYYKIVGVLDCDSYFGCGIPAEEWASSSAIVVFSDGIDDMSAVLHQIGIDVRENYDTVIDFKWGEKFMKKEITDAIGNSTKFIYAGITVLLFIALTIVYTTYLRDRHNEWCLYCSIGYSRRAIYSSIMKELLFTFGAALLTGAIIISASVVILNYAILEPQGLKCRFFYPETIAEILCTYALLLGILQIPVRYALYRIRTVDAMEDELY